jgi:hypothetical protein
MKYFLLSAGFCLPSLARPGSFRFRSVLGLLYRLRSCLTFKPFRLLLLGVSFLRSAIVSFPLSIVRDCFFCVLFAVLRVASFWLLDVWFPFCSIFCSLSLLS